MAEAAGPRSLRQLLQSILVIARSDLDIHSVLRLIVESACTLVDARYGALAVLDEAGTHLSDFIVVGLDDDAKHDIGALPKGNGILGVLIRDARPLRLADLTEHSESFGFPPHHPPMHSFLGVPILVGDAVFGNLYLTDKTSSEVFTDVDEELVIGLAAAAGIAIERVRLHRQLQRLALADERERIARDLHDTVIQRIFGASLMLQSASAIGALDAERAAARIDEAIEQLDLTVRHMRTVIFDLERQRSPVGGGFRVRALEITNRAAKAIGFAPTLSLEGPIDTQLDDTVGNEVAAVLTELLSNVARHARAQHVDVSIRVDPNEICLRVTDDGVGPPAPDAPRGCGLDNAAARANGFGGSFTMARRPKGGTVAEWCVPLQR